MSKKSNFELSLDKEITKIENRLNNILNEKMKLEVELGTLKKSRELFIQSKRKRVAKGE